MLARLILCFFAISHTAAALAQDLLSCVDPDVMQALVFQGTGTEILVSREMPTEFDDFIFPDDFVYIGSSVSSFQTVIAYKTSERVKTAFDVAVESLVNSGWQKLPNAMQQTGGFTNNALPTYSRLCREDQMLSVIARRTETSTYVSMSIPSDQFSSSCAPMMSSLAIDGIDRGLSQYMPTLSLPEGTNNPRRQIASFSMGGTSSDSRTARTSIGVSTQLSAQELIDHFGQQLDSQGWRMDTRWLGRTSAGSAWSAQPDDTISLFGGLDVVRTADLTYQAYFRVTKLD